MPKLKVELLSKLKKYQLNFGEYPPNDSIDEPEGPEALGNQLNSVGVELALHTIFDNHP